MSKKSDKYRVVSKNLTFDVFELSVIRPTAQKSKDIQFIIMDDKEIHEILTFTKHKSRKCLAFFS